MGQEKTIKLLYLIGFDIEPLAIYSSSEDLSGAFFKQINFGYFRYWVEESLERRNGLPTTTHPVS